MSLNSISFMEFCHFCEKLKKLPKKGQLKTTLLKTFFHKTTGYSFMVLRFLLPHLDRLRNSYGIKEKKLAAIYMKMFCLNSSSEDAQTLLNYKLSGKFADVAYKVLAKRLGPTEKSLDIKEIDQTLEQLSSFSGENQQGKVEDILMYLLQNMTAVEQKWLICIILKDLPLGIGSQGILRAYHPDAKEFYDVTNSLLEVTEKLNDPKVRLHELGITLMVSFRPMLAERSNAKDIEKLFHEPFYIETKFDGERCQLHKNKSNFKFFSRNGYDFTSCFGSNFSSGNYSQFAANCFAKDCETAIIDGEMLIWDQEKGHVCYKGQGMDVKYLRIGSAFNPCLFAFDILFYNGSVLTNLPLTKRLEVLEKAVTPVVGRLHLVDRIQGRSSQDAVDALNTAIDNREEGVVLKSISSVYKPNARKEGWVKLKPDYEEGIMDDLDLIIIGGYYGEGKKTKIISRFLLGAVSDTDSQIKGEKIFHSICRVGSGYTMMELNDLLMELEPKWRKFKKDTNCTPNIVWGKMKPEVWIEPKYSKIVQVRAAEIVNSDKYEVGLTLRFPRVEKIRNDKSWDECTTISEIKELRQKASGKLVTKNYVIDNADEERPRKKARYIADLRLAEQFRPADLTEVSQISSTFHGKEFCVITGHENMSKQTLEEIIYKLGGTIIQNPGPGTFCVIASKANVRVKSLIQSQKYNIVHPKWLLNCNHSNKCLGWSPIDLVYANPDTKKLLEDQYDVFGDSFTAHVTPDTLKSIFNKSENQHLFESLEENQIIQLEEELFHDRPLHGLFRGLLFYFDTFRQVENSSTDDPSSILHVWKHLVEFHGGRAQEKLDGVSHVVMSSTNTSRIKLIQSKQHHRERKYHIVDETWIEMCLQEGRLIPEERYL